MTDERYERYNDNAACVAPKPHLQGCSSFFGLWHKHILEKNAEAEQKRKESLELDEQK